MKGIRETPILAAVAVTDIDGAPTDYINPKPAFYP